MPQVKSERLTWLLEQRDALRDAIQKVLAAQRYGHGSHSVERVRFKDLMDELRQIEEEIAMLEGSHFRRAVIVRL